MRFSTIAVVLAVFATAGYGYASLFTSSHTPAKNRVKSWPTVVDSRRVVQSPPPSAVQKLALGSVPERADDVERADKPNTDKARRLMPEKAQRAGLASAKKSKGQHPIALPTRKPVVILAAVAQVKRPDLPDAIEAQPVGAARLSTVSSTTQAAPSVEAEPTTTTQTVVAALKETADRLIAVTPPSLMQFLNPAAQRAQAEARSAIAKLEARDLASEKDFVRPASATPSATDEKAMAVIASDAADAPYSNIVTGSISGTKTRSAAPASTIQTASLAETAHAQGQRRLEVVAASRYGATEPARVGAPAVRKSERLALHEQLPAKITSHGIAKTERAAKSTAGHKAAPSAAGRVLAANARELEPAGTPSSSSTSAQPNWPPSPLMKPDVTEDNQVAELAPPVPSQLLRKRLTNTEIAALAQRRRRMALARLEAVERPAPRVRPRVLSKRTASRHSARKSSRRLNKLRRARRAKALRRRAALKRQHRRARKARVYNRKRRARRFRNYRQFQAYRNRAIANQLRRRRHIRGIY